MQVNTKEILLNHPSKGLAHCAMLKLDIITPGVSVCKVSASRHVNHGPGGRAQHRTGTADTGSQFGETEHGSRQQTQSRYTDTE